MSHLGLLGTTSMRAKPGQGQRKGSRRRRPPSWLRALLRGYLYFAPACRALLRAWLRASCFALAVHAAAACHRHVCGFASRLRASRLHAFCGFAPWRSPRLRVFALRAFAPSRFAHSRFRAFAPSRFAPSRFACLRLHAYGWRAPGRTIVQRCQHQCKCPRLSSLPMARATPAKRSRMLRRDKHVVHVAAWRITVVTDASAPCC